MLGAGLFALLAVLIVGGIDVTAVQLAKMRVLDAADAAALSAADDVSRDDLYRNGLGDTLPLSSDRVVSSARTSLSTQDRPAHVSDWAVSAGTGSPDGRTAVVRVSARVQPPLSGPLLGFFGTSVTVRVESHARSAIR